MLFSVSKRGTNVVLCCRSPSSSCLLTPVWPFSSEALKQGVSTGCVLFFTPFRVNSVDCCAWKSQEISSVKEILTPARLAPAIIARFKSLKPGKYKWCKTWTCKRAFLVILLPHLLEESKLVVLSPFHLKPPVNNWPIPLKDVKT